MTLYRADLAEQVLFTPPSRADALHVVSGYATPAMLGRHILELRSRITDVTELNLVVGMTGGVQPDSGMVEDHHRGFMDVVQQENDLQVRCSYVFGDVGVHSKAYVWSRGGEPVIGFVGSANYTQVGFGLASKGHREEILLSADPREVKEYWDTIETMSVDCLHGEVDQLVRIFRRPAGEYFPAAEDDVAGSSPVPGAEVERLRLSLVAAATGQVHGPGGGLNWGQSRGRANPNEAYVHVPAPIQRSGFFPPKNTQFLVSTDDGKVLIMSVASGEHGKDLRTPLNNGLLGEYFRSRLGLANGVEVDTDDLIRYGRIDVELLKIDEETYLMDFSV